MGEELGGGTGGLGSPGTQTQLMELRFGLVLNSIRGSLFDR